MCLIHGQIAILAIHRYAARSTPSSPSWSNSKITLWSVFFLVPTGRGKLNDLLNADEFEQVSAKIHRLSKVAGFEIKTTEAQHYRRYVLQQRVAERKPASLPMLVISNCALSMD
jgi:MoaA/NifB/PqqE/SkfB family radical SAM enzyme